jgi:hypothetical protein
MTSPAFEGEVRFEYDTETGLMRGLDVPAGLGVLQLSFLLAHIPASVAEMRGFPAFLKKANSSASVREVFKDVSFEDFWERYFSGRGSDNSSKKKARVRWERMSISDRMRAFEYIPRYLNKIPHGIGVKLAETYLNSELWDN